MKILCFIDNLGAGGAQRQLVGLARMLVEHRYEVAVGYYQPDNFFEKDLSAYCVRSFRIEQSSNKITSFYKIYKSFQEFKPEVVISFLESPSIITCVLRILGLRFKLIVSERNTNIRFTLRDRLRFQLFRIADYVVPNSYSQEKFLINHCAYLKNKIRTITNFCSFLQYEVENKTRHELAEISVVASIWPPKNVIRFIQALRILKDRDAKFHVSWYGKIGDTPYLQDCNELIAEHELFDYISLLDKTKNIADVYRQADFFCLPSLYEGTPNVICEAICMSLPVICSDVCDNSIYVKKDENGFLFNPNDEKEIASCLEKALSLNDEEYASFSKKSREIAGRQLSESSFINKYISLIKNG